MATGTGHTDWWTPKECANKWRISASTVERWCASGRLTAKKFGRQWRIHVSAVTAFEQDGLPRTRTQPCEDLSAYENLRDYVGA